MLTPEYIKSCLDARGMPSDDATAQKAFEHWKKIIEDYEDDFFNEAMANIEIFETE